MRDVLQKLRRKPIATVELPLATDSGGTLVLKLYRRGRVRWSAFGGREPFIGLVDHVRGTHTPPAGRRGR